MSHRLPSALVATSAAAALATLALAGPAHAAPTFAAPTVHATNASDIWSIAVTDADGDGRPDVVVPGPSSGLGAPGTLGVLTGRSNGTLRPVVASPGGDVAGIVSGDFDGDGAVDVFTGSFFGGGPSSAATTAGAGSRPPSTSGWPTRPPRWPSPTWTATVPST